MALEGQRTGQGSGGTVRAPLWPTARAAAWVPFGAASATAVALMAEARMALPDMPASGLLLRLTIAAVVLGGGAVFALDDAAAVVLAASPTPLWRRRAVRVAALFAAWVVSWGAVLAVAGTAPGGLAPAGLTLQAVGWLVVAVVIALAFGPVATAPGLLAAAVVALRLPEGWALVVPPGTPAWIDVRLRWYAVVALGVAGFAFLSRDPARRRGRR